MIETIPRRLADLVMLLWVGFFVFAVAQQNGWF